MASKYGLDIYRNGKWIVAPCDFSSVNNARVYMGDSREHYHIWFNGVCVYDSHPGAPEPANAQAPAAKVRITFVGALRGWYVETLDAAGEIINTSDLYRALHRAESERLRILRMIG